MRTFARTNRIPEEPDVSVVRLEILDCVLYLDYLWYMRARLMTP